MTTMMAGMGWPGLLLMVFLWGGTIALILWGVSSLFPSDPVNVERNALAILRRRYAQGELSHGEFLQACAALDLYAPEPIHRRPTYPSEQGPK
ncbi:MAG: hypothetical protein HC828_04115 [Blastochloris sp.]|nr:hypothetical protein [Blastochloris sp.]